MKKKQITLDILERDRVDGCIQSVHRDQYVADWLGTTERTVRNFLAGGDYSEGDEDREVEVSICRHGQFVFHDTYTAPQIRRFRHRDGTR